VSVLAGCGLSLLAGAMQGTFPLPMKFTTKWRWENTWCAFALWGFVVLPWILAFATVPDLIGVYASASTKTMAAVTLFGVGWGVGTICFGVGVSMVGLALAFAIVVGVAGALGALLPMLLFHPEAFGTIGGLAISGGVILMLLGVAVCASAGIRKERASANAAGIATNAESRGRFAKGIAVCLLGGTASPMLNFAFVFGDELIVRAEATGASPAHAGNAIWCWTMTAAFATTLAYCLYLMRRDRGWNRYAVKGAGIYWGLALLMGVLWSGSIAVYGIGLSTLGPLAASIGWPLLMIGSIMTGNVCGILSGEWRNEGAKPLMRMIVGLMILTGAICLVGAGIHISPRLS
jgi:L-rhamnose-H+ transport protein